MTLEVKEGAEIRYFVDVIEEQGVELSMMMGEIKSELLGYLASTGKVDELSAMGGKVGTKFDFEYQLQLLESDRKTVRAQLQSASHLLSGLEPVADEVVDAIEGTLANLKALQRKQRVIISSINEHNKFSKRYRFTAQGLLEISNAGFIARFSKEYKNAKKCLDLIQSDFGMTYLEFHKSCSDISQQISEFEDSIAQKQRAKKEYDEASSRYVDIQSEYEKTQILPTFNAIIEDAVVDHDYIANFAMVSGDDGGSVVTAMLKYKLLSTLKMECELETTRLKESNYSLSDGRNFEILSSDINAIINRFNAVRDCKSAVSYSSARTWKGVYKCYLDVVGTFVGEDCSGYLTRDVQSPKLDNPVVDNATAVNANEVPVVADNASSGSVFSKLVRLSRRSNDTSSAIEISG